MLKAPKIPDEFEPRPTSAINFAFLPSN